MQGLWAQFHSWYNRTFLNGSKQGSDVTGCMLMKDLSVENRLEGKGRSRRTRRGCGSNGNRKRWG